jgi:hypothetical protein
MQSSKVKTANVVLNEQEALFKKLDLTKGMSISRAVFQTSDYIDNQIDPIKFANSLIQDLKVPLQYITDNEQVKILALAVVEQLLIMDKFDPDQAAELAVAKLGKISKRLPFLFNKPVVEVVKKKGIKRDIATQIYLKNKDLDTKSIVSLIAKELDVTTQNAYTYLYLIKKSLNG